LELQFTAMSTLVQIESEVVGLPPQEQRKLLTWLQRRLAAASAPEDQPTQRSRQAWLAELAELRAKTRTGLHGTLSQDILNELREERC
jgi:cytochrome P450